MATNEAEYNDTGSEYVQWRQGFAPILESVDDYTIFQCMLPSILNNADLLKGQRVLDLGCGEGRYTRKLKALNCAYILGVDLSSTMVDIARKIEHQSPQNIEYMVADAQELAPPEHPFDLVTAFYLLHYAETRSELLHMARTIYAQLGENKHFIGVNLNVLVGKDIFTTNKHRKYGFTYSIKTPLDDKPIPDGTEVAFTLYNNRDEIITAFRCYYLSPTTYEQVFKEAGFRSFHWVPYQCNPDALNRAFYNDIISCPYSVGIIAIK